MIISVKLEEVEHVIEFGYITTHEQYDSKTRQLTDENINKMLDAEQAFLSTLEEVLKNNSTF